MSPELSRHLHLLPILAEAGAVVIAASVSVLVMAAAAAASAAASIGDLLLRASKLITQVRRLFVVLEPRMLETVAVAQEREWT